MHGFLLANGPKFKINHEVLEFNLLDLYNVFCMILEIKPNNNNGTLDNLYDILKKGNCKTEHCSPSKNLVEICKHGLKSKNYL